MRESSGHRAAHRKAGRNRARRKHGRSGTLSSRIADRNSLTGRASRALGWSFGSTLLNKVSMFGIGVMLARLLGPHAFGTYAVAYVAMFALLNFNELGVSLAIVRWPGDPRDIIPTVTTISLTVSVVIYAGCFFGAPAYASAMGAPAATTVIRVLAILVLSDGFTNTPAAILQRNFRQGQRTIADQVNLWLGTGVTVALAWSGFGAMSLAIGRVTGCVAGAILLLIFAPESLRLGFDPAKARALLRFGLPLCGANFIAFAVSSVDQLVVGHVLGTVALGYYVLALNLANWPITMFSQPVRTVGPAVFARLQHDGAAMRSTFLSAAGLLCAVALPVCLLIGGSAIPLISFVYGARWLPAAHALMWLALLGAVQVFFLLAYDFFVVLARSRFLLSTQLVWLLALVPALIAGSRLDGLYGASLAELAVAAGCILPWYLIQLRKAGIPLGALAGRLWLPVAGAVLVALAALEAAQVAPGDFTALTASGIAMAAVVGLLVFRMRTVFSMIRQPAAVPAAAGHTDQAVVAPTADGELPAADAAEALPAGHAGVDVPPAWVPDHFPVRQVAHDPLLSRTAYQDQTGPLPPYRDLMGYPPPRQDLVGYPPPRHDLTATSPLYWKTVAALRWDPSGRHDNGADDTSLTRAPSHRGVPQDTVAFAADGSLAGRSRRAGRGSMPATADAFADIAHEERS